MSIDAIKLVLPGVHLLPVIDNALNNYDISAPTGGMRYNTPFFTVYVLTYFRQLIIKNTQSKKQLTE